MTDRRNLIPRKIWTLWYQGLSEAPFIVKKCIDSWMEENRNWEVIVLDKNNLGEYIDLDLPDEKLVSLPLAKQSNLVRLQLLAEYGGVWADSTSFCMRPLDDWIDDCVASGFFAFRKPGRDRTMANWFMASEKECPIITKLRDSYVSFFMKNDFNVDSRFKRIIVKGLSKILNRNEKSTVYWFSPVVTEFLKVYPNFVFHYLFRILVSSDSECRAIWSNTKKLSADEPLKIFRGGVLSPANDDIKNEIDEKRVPVYKLTWKYNHRKYSQSSVLHYLLEGRH